MRTRTGYFVYNLKKFSRLIFVQKSHVIVQLMYCSLCLYKDFRLISSYDKAINKFSFSVRFKELYFVNPGAIRMPMGSEQQSLECINLNVEKDHKLIFPDGWILDSLKDTSRSEYRLRACG